MVKVLKSKEEKRDTAKLSRQKRKKEKADARKLAQKAALASKPPKLTFHFKHPYIKYRVRCRHMKYRGYCKLCDNWGGQYCTHGSFKNHCKTCTPQSLCPHGKRKFRCRDCPLYKKPTPSRVCVDCFKKAVKKLGELCWSCRLACPDARETIVDRIEAELDQTDKSRELFLALKKAKPKVLKPCAHADDKVTCTICTPVCAHMKRMGACKLCPGWGSRYCVHDKTKQLCRICCPQSFCEHGRRKNTCRECPTFRPQMHYTRCAVCMGKSVMKKGMICATCRTAALIRKLSRDEKINKMG